MFVIYDLKGRHFRDTVVNLRKARETAASHGMQLRSNVFEVVV